MFYGVSLFFSFSLSVPIASSFPSSVVFPSVVFLPLFTVSLEMAWLVAIKTSSEELAATSEELSSNAQLLIKAISFFDVGIMQNANESSHDSKFVNPEGTNKRYAERKSDSKMDKEFVPFNHVA